MQFISLEAGSARRNNAASPGASTARLLSSLRSFFSSFPVLMLLFTSFPPSRHLYLCTRGVSLIPLRRARPAAYSFVTLCDTERSHRQPRSAHGGITRGFLNGITLVRAFDVPVNTFYRLSFHNHECIMDNWRSEERM